MARTNAGEGIKSGTSSCNLGSEAPIYVNQANVCLANNGTSGVGDSSADCRGFSLAMHNRKSGDCEEKNCSRRGAQASPGDHDATSGVKSNCERWGIRLTHQTTSNCAQLRVVRRSVATCWGVVSG